MAKIQMIRDPRAIQELVSQRPAKPLAAAFDLASVTGLAFTWYDPKAVITPASLRPLFLNQLDLTTEKFESGALRFVRFNQFLRELNPSAVWFEDVKYSAPGGLNMRTIGQVMARTYPTAEFLGALKGLLSAYCEENNVPCAGIPIGTIKKRATGRGNVGKPDVIKACNETFGTDFDPETFEQTGADNIADAAFCLLCGLESCGGGVPT